MQTENITERLAAMVVLSAEYCSTVEGASGMERDSFIRTMLRLLPKLYLDFSSVDPEDVASLGEGEYFAEYVDEQRYNDARRGVAALMGEDDVFLETFEEDMKYSDTPIATTVSESLADIFQTLYDFVGVVNDTDGDSLGEAWRVCREKFEDYWGQTLCNVMRPLNHLRFGSR